MVKEVTFNTIALVGVVGFILVSLVSIFGIIIYKFDKLRIKTDNNIKTDLQNGKLEYNSSINIEGDKNAKENSGSLRN